MIKDQINTPEAFKEMFDRYQRYLLEDLTLMEQIAETKARAEFENSKQGNTVWPETTSRDGNPIKLPDYYQGSRCAIPMCFLAFSAMDFLGRIIEPLHKELKERHFETTDFARHSQLFFHYLAHRSDLANKASATILERNYRHSIMHSFLPSAASFKTGYSIAYRSFDLISNSLFSSEHYNEQTQVLNVKYLLDALREGLKNFGDLLQDGNYTSRFIEEYNGYLQDFQTD